MEILSSLKVFLNLSKSYAFYIGFSMGKNFKPFSSRGLSWPTSVIKYLGVNIPLKKFDELSLFEENFASTIHNLQSTLNLLLVRGLTLLGKITVLKTFVIQKLIYKSSYLPIQLPKKFVKQLNRVLFTFVWDSKWEKIERSQLCCSIVEGGAKMIHVKQYLTALKFKWIFTIFNENFVADWKTIENICLKENLLFFVLRSNCKFSSMMMNSLVFLHFS